jgi:hypothetical protein
MSGATETAGATANAPAPSLVQGKRRTGVWVAVGVFVIALLVAAAVIGSLPSGSHTSPGKSPSPPPPPPPSATHVNLTGVAWKYAPTTCWNDTSTGPTNVPGGDLFNVSVSVSYAGGSSKPTYCIVDSESVTTSGFSLVNSNTPLTVNAGSTETLTLEIRSPNENLSEGLTTSGSVSTGPTPAPNEVTISTVNWDFSGPSNCWSDMTGNGTVVDGGAQFAVTIRLSYTAGLLDPDSCTVQSESVSTSGFTYVSSNTPLVVDSGSTQTLSVTLDAPDVNETTALTLDGVVTSP